MSSVPAGVAKTIDRTRDIITSGSHYEAQQMLKTVYHRHKARKQIQESYAVLKEGAKLQLINKQITCGVELGLMLIEAFSHDRTPVGEGLPAILEILSSLPSSPPSPGTAAEEAMLDEEGRLVTAATKWTKRQNQPEAARQLHDAFAWHVWKSFGWQRMGRASLHFARGSNAERFAEALHECCKLAPPAEADLFVCRAVLQTLATATAASSAQRQLAHAKQLLQASQDLAPQLDTPLVHFTSFLLQARFARAPESLPVVMNMVVGPFVQALQHKSKPLVTLLKQKYQASLARDPVIAAYLTQVERVFLGVGAPSGGLGGLLGGLLKSLTDMDEDDNAPAGGDDMDEDDDQ